jgi:peptidoglycan/LPS O-acetylase OafA/YrhL
MSQAAERRIPSLDGLRAISIGLVLLGHLAGTQFFPLSEAIGYHLNLAELGVRVFFVISGFLITGLLLDEIDRRGRISLGHFYFRRTLRIFPPYYAYLFAVLLAGALGYIQLSPHDALRTLTYTSNYYPERSWYVGHTWSLSVEEQFYLLWPFILVVAGVKRGLWIAAAAVVAFPVARFVEWNFLPSTHSGIGVRFETIADAIAIGCVLAGLRSWLHTSPLYMRAIGSPWFLAVPVAGIAANMLHDHPQVSFAVGMTAANVCVALVIDWCVTFHDGRIGRVLNTAPMVFVGWLSYSLYLWQQPFLDDKTRSPLTAFPQNILIVIGLALASYFLVERPSLGLRKALERKLFRKAPPAAAPAVAPAEAESATRGGDPLVPAGY